jgi:hypothetical protein
LKGKIIIIKNHNNPSTSSKSNQPLPTLTTSRSTKRALDKVSTTIMPKKKNHLLPRDLKDLTINEQIIQLIKY